MYVSLSFTVFWFIHTIQNIKCKFVIPCIFTGSKQVPNSIACMPFSSTLQPLEQMPLDHQCSDQYRCSKGKHFYAHLVIMVIWDKKSFFTYFFLCEEQKGTFFCIISSKTGFARVTNIAWVGKRTPLNLETWWQNVNIMNYLIANYLQHLCTPTI